MINEDRIFSIENQKVILNDKIKGNHILDIGGGGEGIIGLCYGNRVTAIDPSKEELEEAGDGPLKIIMDSRNLLFLDKTFDVVTSFFTQMYIKKSDHIKAFSEIYRVLKDDGEFIVWDTIIPKYDNNSNKDIFVIKLEINTPLKLIKTGYGVVWQDNDRDIKYYIDIGKKVGFKVNQELINDRTFKIVFKKYLA